MGGVVGGVGKMLGGGGGGGKKGAAKAPDFMGLANTPTSNPYGSVSTGPNGRSFQFTGQAADVNRALMENMAKSAGMDPSQAGAQAQKTVMDFQQSRLDPMWQGREQAAQTGLANQGLEPGSEAYANASRAFGQQRNDAYSQAMSQAVGLGQAEQAQARQNQMMPYAQASSLMGLGQQQPDTSKLLGAAGMQYGANQDQQSAANNKKGSSMSGLGSIAGTIFGGPAGGMAGGALGKMFGSGTNGSGKKGATEAKDFTPGGAYEGWT